MLPTTFTTQWVKGKEHAVADALSRNPSSDPTPDDLADEIDLFGSVAFVVPAALSALTGVEVASGALEGAEGSSFSVVTSGDVPGDALLEDLRQTGTRRRALHGTSFRQCRLGALPKDFETVGTTLWVQDGLVLHGLRIVPPEGASRRAS